jgi:hypothetical protein
MNKKTLTRNNIFPPAWNAVKNDPDFPWHDQAYKINSSQALAIDVFGTIQFSTNRNKILDELSSTLGIPGKNPWSLELEWNDPNNLLNESRARSQIDVVLNNSKSLVFSECKFTEPAGGSCSQTLPFSSGSQKGLIQCDGSYSEQVNPYNNISSKCVLTGKKIRYWGTIDKIFNKKIYDYENCPFSGSWYQWMRNITICYEVAKHQNLTPFFLLVYADDKEFNISQELKSEYWVNFLNHINPNTVNVHTISYQQITELIINLNLSDHDIWLDLRKWIKSKIYISSIITKYRK